METKLVRGVAAGVAAVALAVSGVLTSWWGIQPIPAEGLHDQTCALARLAVDDPAAAADGFMIDVHGPLHTVARDLVASDRTAAARLLEAKGAVERGIDETPTNGAELSDRLAVLAERLPGSRPCEEM